MLTRRELIRRALLLAVGSGLPRVRWCAAEESVHSAGQVFDRAWLRREARLLAAEAYVPPAEGLPDWLADLDWDAYQSIRFRPERALWRGQGLPFEVRLFHLGLFFRRPVQVFEVVHGVAHPIPYRKDLFAFGPGVDAPRHPGELGFAGFRVGMKPDVDADMFAFLGASYFRAVGQTRQYGLSARGLAVDTGFPRPEEFPDFRAFWLERPSPRADRVTLHALLDSPSIAGAYHFVIRPGDTTVMEIEAYLHPRKPIERVGIAPLTSMYQYGENDRRVSDDWRPEIHDSDGLSLWTGTGEWIWRPLVNAPAVRVNSFLDENPKGFGLLQRDRNFDHYQDDGANYHRRPALWVEPLGAWGKGAIQLVEIPGPDETFDNIVAFWNPAEAFVPGHEYRFRYRLYWGSESPARTEAAEVVATRIGAGGIPGQKHRVASRKFVVDFAGGPLSRLTGFARVEPVIGVSRGEVRDAGARPLLGTDRWRCSFDLVSSGVEPIDLRCFLRDRQGVALTETWLYQWTPRGNPDSQAASGAGGCKPAMICGSSPRTDCQDSMDVEPATP